jgi:hypothetical protein
VLSSLLLCRYNEPMYWDWESFPNLWSTSRYWLVSTITCVLCLAKDVAWKGGKRAFDPMPYHIVQEISRAHSGYATGSAAGHCLRAD